MTIDSSTRDKVIELHKQGKTRDAIAYDLNASGIKISTGSCSNIIKKYEQSLQSKPQQSSNQDKVTTVLPEVEFKKDKDISIENLKRKGAQLSWFTSSSDYQSPLIIFATGV